MIFYYLDSSAWVKRYYYEVGTIWIQELFANNQIAVCASIGLIEVIATLARKCKSGAITLSILEQKIRNIENDWEHFIQIDLTAEVIESAKKLAKELALRGADAIHLASALVTQRNFVEDNDQLIFVASDRELKEASQKYGLIVIDPSEQVNKTI